jgi:hypothetical protein
VDKTSFLLWEGTGTLARQDNLEVTRARKGEPVTSAWADVSLSKAAINKENFFNNEEEVMYRGQHNSTFDEQWARGSEQNKKYKEKGSSWQVFRLQFLIQHFRSKWIRIEGFSLLKVSSTLARKC